ncbi:MAG: aldo/keto reductase [Lactobacillaceae bacterium]|nr:aldo/keto reductase [Lactobacillaceae bacterium]
MKTQQLGTSEVKDASAVALGVMRISEKSADEAIQVVNAALEAGINFFDTADIYGAGKSSTVFGQALKDAQVNREDIYLQSKGGIILPDGQINGDGLKGPRFDFSKDHLIASVDIELERLQTEYLDFFLLHRPDVLMEVDEIAEAFSELKASGKVRNFGVSNFTPLQIQLLQQATDQRLEVNQLQFGLGHADMISETLLLNMGEERSIERTFDSLTFAQLNKITIQAWSPFQYGMFEGVFVDSPKFGKLNDTLQALADKYGVTKNGIAVAWINRHPAGIQTIIGSMNPTRIKEMSDIDSVNLTKQEWYDLYLAAGNILP